MMGTPTQTSTRKKKVGRPRSFTQHLLSKDTTSGEKREIWLQYAEDGRVQKVCIVRNGGKPTSLIQGTELPAIRISVNEYDNWVAFAEINNILYEG